MPKRQVFYSFHFANDVWRVQQVRNMGMLEGNTPVSPNEWEEVKRKGSYAIRNWIDESMRYRSCLVVLYGQETYSREWVQYEIEHAWNSGKGVAAISIDRLADRFGKQSFKGKNPLSNFVLNTSSGKIRKWTWSQYGERNLVDIAPTFDTFYLRSDDAYNDIKEHLEGVIEEAIRIRNRY